MSAPEETNTTTETPVPAPAVETPAPVQADAPADPNAPASTDRDDKGRFRNPVQPRIDELTRKTREAEREIAYWRNRAEAREAKEAEAAKAAEPKKPDVKDFDDYNAFVEALTDWKADEKVKANNEAQKQESAKERAARERSERWAERSNATRARVPDFDQVLESSDVKIADFVSDALDDSERSADLVYQIAKDPSIADRLNAMTPRQAALELGRMESRLPPVSAEPDPEEVPADRPTAPAPAPAAVRKTTSAPPPVRPISKGAATTVPLEKLGMDDYVKRRASEGATWARR